MNNSPDGQYIFVGLPCGLIVTEALTQQVICSWEAENAEMSYIKSYTLAPQIYMITTIDDMGKYKLNTAAVQENQIFFMLMFDLKLTDLIMYSIFYGKNKTFILL